MPLPASLLALVLLVLCGGIEPGWTPESPGDATERPVAPEAPAEAESDSGGEEAVCEAGPASGPGERIMPTGLESEMRSVEASIELQPPRG